MTKQFVPVLLTLFLCSNFVLGQSDSKLLKFNGEILTNTMSPSKVMEKLNTWAIDNSQTYSSVVQTRDSTSIVIKALTSVLMVNQNSRQNQVEQEAYIYQILARSTGDGHFQITFRNYLSTIPNSRILTTKADRMHYIENLPQARKHKKILVGFAEEEYNQLEKSAENIVKQFQSIVNQ